VEATSSLAGETVTKEGSINNKPLPYSVGNPATHFGVFCAQSRRIRRGLADLVTMKRRQSAQGAAVASAQPLFAVARRPLACAGSADGRDLSNVAHHSGIA